MQLRRLRLLLVDELQEMYIAEEMVAEELKRMEKGAAAAELQALFQQHSERTKGQIARLELVFEKLKDNPRGGHGKSMKALLTESEDRMGDGGEAAVVDAALIATARRVEHWGIASYSSTQAFAQRLGLDDVAGLLGQTVAEKQDTDTNLAGLLKTIPTTAEGEA